MSAQQKKPQFIHGQSSMGLPFQKELVVDLFAGGGGASTGIARAYREPDVAVNHNPIALAVHRANHPDMPEILYSIGEFVPVESLVRGLGYNVEWRERIAANAGTPTIRKRLYLVARSDGKPIVWPAPKRHKAPTAKQLPWRTAAECIDWSNLGRTIFRDKPMAVNTMRRVAKGCWRHVLTCAKPFIVPMRGTSEAHTSTHGVDEALSTISAGGTHHALVQPVAAPFLTECANGSSQRNFSALEPLRTQVAQVKGGHFAMAAANMVTLRKGSVGADVADPLGVVATSTGHHAISAAFFEQANGGFYKGDGRSAYDPISTICQSRANQRLVNTYLVKYYGNERDGISLTEPMHILPTKDRIALVEVVQVPDTLTPELLEGARRCAAFMHEHLPEHFKDPADLVMVGGYVLVDITLRMLQPPELKAAQGFDKDYIIDRGLFVDPATGAEEWRDINKTDQVRLIGNSVCPDEAEDLVVANAADIIELYQRLAA
ncbi:DNA cytosine methyltransferase [Pseudomonas sp. PDM28]|uniref:DNA cytosine methyltransferase n=1 Tax=Pseudomonas sp. PDM28 TaxID=2854770 RepID=UPI001C44FB43|nr:DNA cytosine methyltransferase [Pseudomonas sp. PDM28]MBV7552002.1 DNA cytosine methyltransferase [Pseudomonas sp. PDM28]